MGVRTIEISFPVEVELPDGFDRVLDALVDTVCKAYERNHPDRVMWPAGRGSKPQWSAADAAFLGKAPADGAPESGEPTFDDSVYCIEVSEREDLHGENPLNPDREKIRLQRSLDREAEKARRKAESPQLVNLTGSQDRIVLEFNRVLTEKELRQLKKSFE